MSLLSELAGSGPEEVSSSGVGLRMPIDSRMLAESKLYAVPYKAYVEMSKRERGVIKMRWARQIKQEARRRRIDPDEFLGMTEEERKAAREQYPEHEGPPKKKASAPRVTSIDEVAERHRSEPDDEEPETGDDDGELEEEAEVFTASAAVPPTEAAPERRRGVTVGPIRQTGNPDLVGQQPPKNLRDVYARWDIGDGSHVIRVERIEPKIFQGIPCAGYVGEIRSPMSEEEFQAHFGGRLYQLTVYGPDPKGREDSGTGLPLVKAKTEPFTLLVPLFPPNLRVLPLAPPPTRAEAKMHPFPFSVPTSASDAKIFESSQNFMQSILQSKDEEMKQLRQAATPSADVVKTVSEAGQRAIDAERKAAEAREHSLQEQIKEEKASRRALEAKLDELMKSRDSRQPTVGEAADVFRMAQEPFGAELARVREAHQQELSMLKQAHQDQIRALNERQSDERQHNRERHEDEVKRLRQQNDDLAQQYRLRVEELERDYKRQLTDQKELAEQMRRDERATAAERVKETSARYEDQIRMLKEQQERELRMLEAQHTTRIETHKTGQDTIIANLKEKIATLKEQLAEAQEEARTAGDPVEVLEKAKKTAEALGFSEKDENAPKTATERFFATTGAGLSKALETLPEWGPKMAERMRMAPPPGFAAAPPRQLAGPQPGGAPPGAPPPQSHAARGPSRRAVSWATGADDTPVAPEYTPRVQAQMAMPAPVAGPPPSATGPGPEVAPPAPPAAPLPPDVGAFPPAPPAAAPAAPEAATTRLNTVFSDEVVKLFRAEVERVIDAGLDPAFFASEMVARHPDAAVALIQRHTPEDLIETVKSSPDGAASPILRRAGTRWVKSLWPAIHAALTRRMQQEQAAPEAPPAP